ncbi:MAG: DUF441 domain-containing protein [Bacillota bacterium]
MSSATLMMLFVLLLGILGKSNVIAAAAGIMLTLQFFRLQVFFPVLEERGLELGLVFLVISVLVPFAAGRVAPSEIVRSFFTVPGLIALISGAVATTMNGQGLELLQRVPSLMIGLVIGSIVGVVFFGGIPVGPLMAGGIAALLLALYQLIR